MDYGLEESAEERNRLPSKKGFKAAGVNHGDFTVIFNQGIMPNGEKQSFYNQLYSTKILGGGDL